MAVSANAAVRDDLVLMDVTAPSGPGFEVNAHSQGVFRAPTGAGFDLWPFRIEWTPGPRHSLWTTAQANADLNLPAKVP